MIFFLLLFKFICEVIEDYVAPGIVYICEYLKLSESLAGVTLIAFANGAGDILTAIVASDSKEGISYNIGSLYGAGLFVLTFVVSMTIFNSPNQIILGKSMVWRDIGMYIFASLFIVCLAIYGTITPFYSIILLLFYIVLVIIVIIQDKLKAKTEELKNEDSQENLNPNETQEDD